MPDGPDRGQGAAQDPGRARPSAATRRRAARTCTTCAANGTEKPERVKVRAPTLANVQAVAHMLEDGYLADLPIVIAAIDPCFSCTDRLIAVDADGRGAARPHGPGTSCAQHGIEWYREQRHRLRATEQDIPARSEELNGAWHCSTSWSFPGFLFLIALRRSRRSSSTASSTPGCRTAWGRRGSSRWPTSSSCCAKEDVIPERGRPRRCSS